MWFIAQVFLCAHMLNLHCCKNKKKAAHTSTYYENLIEISGKFLFALSWHSVSHFFTFLSSAPTGLSPPRLHPVNETTVQIDWDPPAQLNGPHPLYQVCKSICLQYIQYMPVGIVFWFLLVCVCVCVFSQGNITHTQPTYFCWTSLVKEMQHG